MDEPEPRVEERLTVYESNTVLAGLAYAIGAAGLGVTLALFAGVQAAVFGPYLFMLSAALLGLARVGGRWSRRLERDVAVTSAGVEVSGRLVPRAEIMNGYFQPVVQDGASGSRVRLLGKRQKVLFEADASEERAIAILRALGLDAGRRSAEFAALSPLLRPRSRIPVMVLLMVVVFGLMGFGSALLRRHGIAFHGAPLLMMLFAGPLLGFLFRPTKLVIGMDGIHLRWWSRKRFIAMSEILEVVREGETTLRIRVKDGTDEIIVNGNARGSAQGFQRLGRARRDAIYARIMEAWNVYREQGKAADVASLVARGTRNKTEWRAALAELDKRDPGYRVQALRDEDLWNLLEDPRATEDARAAAAVLLRRSLDDAGRTRVRIAAEATASPKLRLALDAAATGADEAMESALEEIATEEPNRKRAAG